MDKFDNKEHEEMLDDDLIVIMTDEEGNEYYYREELIVPVGEKRFAILSPIHVDEDCECGADCECSEDEDVYIARIDTDENGEEVYVDPTDEEFEQVRVAYEQLVNDEE